MGGDKVTALKKRLTPKQVTIDGETFWVAEGDLLLDADQLAEYARQRDILAQQGALRMEAFEAGMGISPAAGPAGLVAVSSGEKLVRWRDGMVLTYCVLRSTFASVREYRLARRSVEAATGAWEETCGVAFEHRAALDTSTSTQVPEVMFTVREIDAGGRFIAAAFFPTDPPERRRVLIDPSFFGTSLSFDRVGVLRHELGHVLGFRHEHIRSDAPPACPDEDLADTIDLTAYDPKSVMHYFCGGVGNRDLAITAVDTVGAQRMYGLPLTAFEFVE